MATLNYAFKELSCKIVYYGCGLCGKTTNLIHVHKAVPQKFRGELVSLATEQDRTLFFDFLPLDLGEVKGFKTKFQLYTVPGQVYYNATRKLVLRGVDGLVFVADSQKDRFQENMDSLENLRQNLAEYGYRLQTGPDDADGIPWVIQYNKRDMPRLSSIEEMEKVLNEHHVPTIESVAVTGQGVKDTLKAISSLVIKKLNQDSGPGARIPTPARTEAAPKLGTRQPAAAAGTAGAPGTRKPAPHPASGYGPSRRPDGKDATGADPRGPSRGRIPRPAGAAAGAGARRHHGAGQTPVPQRETVNLTVTQYGQARVRGLRLGKANLTLSRIAGGTPEQYQVTGRVTFVRFFGSSWSRRLRLLGEEQRNYEGISQRFWKFVSDDGNSPPLEVFVKEGPVKSLFVSYIGRMGEVQILPNGAQPL